MSGFERKRTYERRGPPKDTAVTAKANIAPNYFFPREMSRSRPRCAPYPPGPLRRSTFLEKRYFEPPVSELYNFDRPVFQEPCGNRIQSLSFSFKVPNTYRLEKGELVLSSVKKNCSESDLKPPTRTTGEDVSPSPRDYFFPGRAGKAAVGNTKATLIPKIVPDGSSVQDWSDGNNSKTGNCTVKANQSNSVSPISKKRKADDKVDANSVITPKKKIDPERRVLVLGKAVSITPSNSRTKSNDEMSGAGNKKFRTVMCPLRVTAALNRNSEWEKVAMKSRSIFLKNRSQKMLKDRLEKYCVVPEKTYLSRRERLAEKSGNQTAAGPPLTIKEALSKFATVPADLRSDDLNKKKVEHGGSSCDVGTEHMDSKNSGEKVTSGLVMQVAEDFPFVSTSKTVSLGASTENTGRVEELSVGCDANDIAEIKVKKEVEDLVEEAIHQAGSGSSFCTAENSRKKTSRSVEESRAVAVTNDDAKLKKMWALVAEECSLTSALNDINAKINKMKTDLYNLYNQSTEFAKRLDEVRTQKNQLLSNSQG